MNPASQTSSSGIARRRSRTSAVARAPPAGGMRLRSVPASLSSMTVPRGELEGPLLVRAKTDYHVQESTTKKSWQDVGFGSGWKANPERMTNTSTAVRSTHLTILTPSEAYAILPPSLSASDKRPCELARHPSACTIFIGSFEARWEFCSLRSCWWPQDTYIAMHGTRPIAHFALWLTFRWSELPRRRVRLSSTGIRPRTSLHQSARLKLPHAPLSPPAHRRSSSTAHTLRLSTPS